MVEKTLIRHTTVDDNQPIDDLCTPINLSKSDVMLPLRANLSSSSSSASVSDVRPWNENSKAKEQLFVMFSCAYALVAVVVGVLVELSRILTVHHDARTEGPKELLFSIYMYGGSLIFLVYIYTVLLKIQFEAWGVNRRKTSSKLNLFVKGIQSLLRAQFTVPPANPDSADSEVESMPPPTGGLFLRIGCVVFGLFGVVYCGLITVLCMFEFTSDDGTCTLYTFGSTGLAMLFIFVQMHFVFCNSSITIHHSLKIARFGMMHLVATNLWTWLRYIIIEEQVTTVELQHANFSLSEEFIYGFHRKPPYNNSNSVKKIEECEGVQCVLGSFTEFMYTCIVEYALICATVSFVFWTRIGQGVSAYHKKLQLSHNMIAVDCSQTTTGLFLGFIIVAATFICITVFNSYITQNSMKNTAFMIFYLTKTGFMSICLAAVLLAFYRMRELSFKEKEEDIDESAELLDRILLVFGLTGELIFSIGGAMSLSQALEFHRLIILLFIIKWLSLVQVLSQSALILIGSKLKASSALVKKNKPGKQVVTFLLVVNVALLILNTFEAQSPGVNEDIVRLYGSRSWAFLVRACAPLTIFFRFHSAACFADIWKHSYSSVKGEFDMH